MYENELYHYGIKGQKWGIRRYQNSDGSLTPAGKKHYSKMSDDKLQKSLYKQVKKARTDQSDWSNQWAVNNTIGENSKAVQDKYKKDYDEYMNSKQRKEADKKLKNLDRRFNQGKIDPDEYDKEWENIQKSVYKPELDRSVTIGSNGRKYSKEYIDKYGRDLNIGYLKDLGYDEKTAKEFTERILKANKKMLDGM